MKPKHLLTFLFSCLLYAESVAQDTTYQNTATTLINANNRLSIRGYAEINYNQGFANDIVQNGKLEVRRMVLFTGYKFNKNTSFISEIEIEHSNEIYLEQAFVNHRINPYINFRGGLLLIPMGIVNEYHEPTTFNGVERPNVDKYILPTTWRELGAGVQGIIPQANIAYQLYVVNGFKSHDGENGLITVKNGFRSGRQKGIRSTMSSPNFTAKVDYFGIRNLKLGVSTYVGETQSVLYNGVSTSDDSSLMAADSSIVHLAMTGIDFRYATGPWRFRGQAIMGRIGNTEAYNAFTGNSLSSSMYGYYGEVAYNVLPARSKYQLFPFVRYEAYDTQAGAPTDIQTGSSERQDITVGLSMFLHPGAVLKADYQQLTQGGVSTNQLNLGIGVWF